MNITILDGGMGQELLKVTGAKPTPEWSARVMREYPDAVRQVHDAYFAAGAEVATTNTYCVKRDRFAGLDLEPDFERLQRAACEMAVAARDAHGSGIVAGSIGPLGWSYNADLVPEPARAAEAYAEEAELQSPYVDVLVAETVAGIDPARGAMMGLSGHGKPVWLAVSVDDADGTRLRSGEPVEGAAEVAAAFGADALLVNCSVPEAVSQALPRLAGWGGRLGAYANGFTKITSDFASGPSSVSGLTARTDLTPGAYAAFAEAWVETGADIVGGCCEVGPAHIAEVARRLGGAASRPPTPATPPSLG